MPKPKSKGRYYKSIVAKPAEEVLRRSRRIASTLANNVRSIVNPEPIEPTEVNGDGPSLSQQSESSVLQRCPYAEYGCDAAHATSNHVAQCPWRHYSFLKMISTCPGTNEVTFQLPRGKVDVAQATAMFQEWLEKQQDDPIQTQKRQFAHISADPYTEFNPDKLSDEDCHDMDVFASDGMEPALDPPEDLLVSDGTEPHIAATTFEQPQIATYGRSTFDPTMKVATSTIAYDDYTALQVMLMSNIMQYRGVPLSLFDSIQHTIRYWALHRNLDFNRREIFRTRESLLARLKKFHGMNNFEAQMVNVNISRGRVVGVVIFDFIGVISNMLSDSRIFCPENIAKGYNMRDASAEPSDCYGEVHTGTKFQEARDHFIGDSDQFALPLISFYDRTHTDGKGALTAAPYNITIAFLNIETRMKSYAQFPIGIVPNLKYGLSSDESISSVEAVQDEQDCLYPILKQLIDIEKAKGFDIEILGVKVRARPWIHFSIGDIAGHQSMLACYADNSGKTKRPNRMCRCSSYVYSWEEMNCQWVTLEEVRAARQEYHANVGIYGRKGYAESVMKEISRHPIETVWEKGVPVADQVHGMNLLTPPELLHTVGVGIAKYILAAINSKLEKAESQLLDRLHAALYYDLKRNSDRDFYESSLQKGSTESIKQSAMENVGNVLAILCLSVTIAGNDLLTRNNIGSNNQDEGDEGNAEDEKDISHPLKLFMSCIAWFHSSNPKEEVENAGGLVAAVLHDIIKFIERTDGQGWDIPKSHAWLQFVQYMKFFGNGMNFWGGPGEHSHIRLLKDNARRTQKQVPKFGRQVAERISEDVILEKAEECLIHQIHDDVLSMPQTTSLYKQLHEWRMNRIELKMASISLQTDKCKLLSCEGKHKIRLEFSQASSDSNEVCIQDGDTRYVKHTVVWSSGNAKKQKQNRTLCVEMVIFLSKILKNTGETELDATAFHAAHVQFDDIEEKTVIRCTDRCGIQKK